MNKYNHSLQPKNSITLLDVIKKKVHHKASFDELESDDKRAILKYIQNKQLNIKAFGKKWFDILTQKFYAIQWSLYDDYDLVDDVLSFDTFEEFYFAVDGDIYSCTCLFGYTFSEEEILKYSIKLDLINFDSFISETIDSYSFKAITKEKQKENKRKASLIRRISEWIAKNLPITSFEDLVKKDRQVVDKYNRLGQELFFTVLISNEKYKPFLIEFARGHDLYESFSFKDVLTLYGIDEAQTVIDGYYGQYNYSTRRKRILRFKDMIDGMISNSYSIKRIARFEEFYQAYGIFENYKSEDHYSFMITRYFLSFNEFADYLEGDLSGADLSKAPLDIETIKKYKTDKYTLFPFPKDFSKHQIAKQFIMGSYYVKQRWLDLTGNVMLSDEHKFDYFFDFVHFLKRDLSNANLLMCDGLENIANISNILVKNIKVRSCIASKLKMGFTSLPIPASSPRTFKEPSFNEKNTTDAFLMLRQEDEDLSYKISYISDLHLRHRFDAYKCKSAEDIEYVLNKIAITIAEDATEINIIAGDTADDPELMEMFVSKLKEFSSPYKKFFFTLGNHELWAFKDCKVEEIYRIYYEILNKHDMYLLHDNLFFLESNKIEEIGNDELLTIQGDELRKRLRSAELILFGGIGFAGRNTEFNANSFIYEYALDIEKEIRCTEVFLNLYNKIKKYLYDKNVVVVTHMPMKDWGGDIHATYGFVYINGHTHRNYYYDDGRKRIYADNQVGYYGKRFSLKHIQVNTGFDWFADYKDGIYEITKLDYEKFYRGIGEFVTFNREFEKLYLIKRENTYMFLMMTPKGTLQILNGGSIKKAGNHSLEYFYENLVNYSKSVKMFLSGFDSFQKNVSKDIKAIGGDGTIHGSIVDVDFYSHLYLNPLNGTITPYFAYSMVDKYVYKNVTSLLKYKCPEVYEKYEKLISDKTAPTSLVAVDNNLPITNKTVYVGSTEMYKISRILNGLQFTTKYNVVRLWSDAFISGPSEENGRMIVSGIIDPSSIPAQIVESKPKITKVKEPKVSKPVLTQEEKIKKRDDKYKTMVSSATNGNIVCLTYRGSTEKADYQCDVCGYKWSTRPDHFKDRQLFQCPYCKEPKRTYITKTNNNINLEMASSDLEIQSTETKHEKSGIKTFRKNEREQNLDLLIMTFIKNNNGYFSKSEIYNELLKTKASDSLISKNSVVNSLSRLEIKGSIIIVSGKVFVADNK